MSSDKSDDEEHDAISKQIVDYYRKYSQTKHLPKYFSGTSLSYMPPIVKEIEMHPKAPIITVDDTSSETIVGKEKETEDIKPVSPTSSITSNRKLEWDNGADIGYDNYQKSTKLQKSTSLPILLVDPNVGSGDKESTKFSTQIVTVISYPSSDDIQEKTPSSSSSTSYRVRAPIVSSSSSAQTDKIASAISTSSSGKTPRNVSTSSSSLTNTIAYLKSKIGLPNAESTPKIDLEAQISKMKSKKRVTLCVTKPINIECVAPKKISDKLVQTSFLPKNVSKSVQTSLEVFPENTLNQSLKPENQSVIIINYDNESDKQICSSNTQTESEVLASQCDSFEYYKNETGFKKSSTDSSKDLPVLGQLISKKQSKSLIGDIDRSIDILQKLLKSKKYDPATKKRYIKKIVEKIVDSKYNEDSTTSSELFVPKPRKDNTCQPKFTVKTFSDEFLPQKSIFVVSKHGESGASRLEKHPSWKEDKTTSERLLEKQKGQGDHLVKFAKKERQHQLSWINDEITHLTKLKGLLEQKKVQRTTTVYMMSQPEYSSCSCSSSHPTTSRNYVIETELSKSGSSSVPTDYNLYDKDGKRKYQVTTSEEDINPYVIGEVEVVSDDATTNIKVRAVKTGQSKGEGKYDTFPKSKAEEEVCWSCKHKKKNEPPNLDDFTFKVPQFSTAILSDKVNAVLGKHATSSEDIFSRSKKIPTEETKTNVLTVVDAKQLCCCYGRQKSKYKYQTDLCGCCTTKIQTGYKKVDPTKIQTSDHKDFDFARFRSCDCRHTGTVCSPRGTKKHKKKSEGGTDFPDKQQGSVQTSDESAKNSHSCENLSTDTKDVGDKQKDSDDEFETSKPENGENVILDRNESDESKIDSKKYKDKNEHKPSNKGTCRNYETWNQNYDTDYQYESDQSLKLSQDIHKSDSGNSENSKHSDQKRQSTDDQLKLAENAIIIPLTDKSSCSDDSIKASKHASPKTHTCHCNFALKSKQYVSAEVQTCFCDKNERTETETSTSTSGSTSTSATSESVASCVCCKRQNVTSQRLYRLREKLSDQTYPLCRPCYRQNRTLFPPGFYKPGHVCNCYSVVQTKTLNEIKKTIKDLNELDEFCTCTKSEKRSNFKYCEYCKCKLKNTSRNRNGIAYMLTFENELVQEKKEKKEKKRSLEEIKIKIPVVTRKRHKDKENKKKKEQCDEGNFRRRKKIRESESSLSDSPKNKTSLQEYLAQNRPEFVEEAEGRRRTVNRSRTQREEMSDYKKLQFLKKCQEECHKTSKRIFSCKEMREINQRNYNKLPEVQQKLIDTREKQLRQASRLMADTFNRKLRENVLKGKRNLPTNRNVICM